MIGTTDTRDTLAIRSNPAERTLEIFMNRYRKRLIVAGSLAAFAMGSATVADAKEAQPAGGPSGTQCPATPPPPGMPSMPPIPMATSVKPSDVSTSTVIKPDPADQIECGHIALKTVSNVAFAHIPGPGGQARDLALDILSPSAPGKYPLVIYVTGGGFVIAPKENGLNLRTFVAENGFVVASIQYRTAMDGATFRDGGRRRKVSDQIPARPRRRLWHRSFARGGLG
ncbi:MAG: carboxylesterase family protein [Candidatus Sphingomonas phytovorans]|nr:carboxylesterase family protein [Sphingomonas sp.]WEK02325.1 MAG: carboxylesterase family protein [Sphingomonas sp.]